MMVPTGAVLALTIIAANALADVLSGGAATPPPLVALRGRSKRKTPDAMYVAEVGPTAPSAALPAEATALFPVEPISDFDDAWSFPPARRCPPSRRRARPRRGGPAAEGELIVEDLVIGVDGGRRS